MLRILIIIMFFCLSVKADQYDQRLENLFSQLLITENETKIKTIKLQIWDIWHETNDPKINADFFRGIGLMHNGNLKESIKFFSKVIEKKPNFAEAWNKRATVFYMLGEYDKSMTDINTTLKLEPRHFGAMDGMILIFLQKGKVDQAVKIYDEIIKIFPKSKSTLKAKQKLLNYNNNSA